MNGYKIQEVYVADRIEVKRSFKLVKTMLRLWPDSKKTGYNDLKFNCTFYNSNERGQVGCLFIM